MASAHAEPVTSTAVRDRLVDAAGRAATMAHEARLLKTLAADAVEDGIHAASRAITRGAHNIDDLRDAAAYRVKKTPLVSVAVAAGAGLLLGMACGWLGRAVCHETPESLGKNRKGEV